MDIIDHGHPHCHIHEMEMMDHVKRSIAASYTSLLSRLDSHIEDNRVHVSCEEKDTWNNKADKSQIRDLEMRLMEKADYCDVIELKEILAKLKAKVNNTSEESSSDGSDYITEKELERMLEDLKEEVTNNIIEYVKTEGIEQDLSNYYTKSEVDSKIANINPGQGGGQSTVSVSYQDRVDSNAQGRYKLGVLTINGQPIDIYGKDAVFSLQDGDDSITVIENPYNDEDVKQRIKDLKDRLDDLLKEVKDEVQENVDDMLSDEELIKKLFPNGGGGYSNFGEELDSYLDKYLQAIGFYNENGTAKWSLIEQELQGIRAKVASIDPDAQGNYDSLLAQLKLDILEDGALAELLTQYTKLSESKKILEWLYSSLKTGARQNMTWADLLSAASNGTDEALANIHTQVTKLSNGEYVSQAELAAKINDTSAAGLATKATVNDAVATLFAENGTGRAYVDLAVSNGISHASISADQIDIDGLINKINAINAEIKTKLKVGGEESYVEVNASQDNTWGYIRCVGPNSSTYISSSTTGHGYTDINGGWIVVSDQPAGNGNLGASWSTSNYYSWIKPGEIKVQGRSGGISIDTNTTWGEDHDATVMSIDATALKLNNTPVIVDDQYGWTGTFIDKEGYKIYVQNGIIVKKSATNVYE